MSKELKYSNRVAPEISVELKEINWSNVSIESQFARIDKGESKMGKAKISDVNPKDADTRLFCLLKVDHKDYENKLLCREIGSLNGNTGFKDCITVVGDTFTVKDNAQVRVVGNSIEFRIKA